LLPVNCTQGYKEKEVTVSVSDGERSDLKVELEKA